MPRYRVTRPGQKRPHFDGGVEVQSLDAVDGLLRESAYERCAVWRFKPAARHWRLIFDTTVPQGRLITSAEYWRNVAAHEGVR
jgi:hypothetical protein